MRKNLKKQKKLLIVGSGGLRGAYSAGVLHRLCKKFGPNYFDKIIGSSAGAYNSTAFISNSTDGLEKLWKQYIDSDKLVDFKNVYQKGHVLDLDYLTVAIKKTCKPKPREIANSKVDLQYVLTDFKTGKAKYIKPTEKNLFKAMNASSAIFPLYPMVKINGIKYLDGGLAEPLPFKTSFIKKFDKILIVHNKENKYQERSVVKFLFEQASRALPKNIENLMRDYFKKIEFVKKEALRHKNIMLLTPSKKIPITFLLDTNQKHLSDTFDLGYKDAKKAIEFLEK